jgi:hypothetical protein
LSIMPAVAPIARVPAVTMIILPALPSWSVGSEVSVAARRGLHARRGSLLAEAAKRPARLALAS